MRQPSNQHSSTVDMPGDARNGMELLPGKFSIRTMCLVRETHGSGKGLAVEYYLLLAVPIDSFQVPEVLRCKSLIIQHV